MGTFALVGEVTEGTSKLVSASDFQTIIDSITQQFNVTTVVSVIGIGVAAAAGLAFTYWGARKLIGMIMTAFKKGKVSM